MLLIKDGSAAPLQASLSAASRVRFDAGDFSSEQEMLLYCVDIVTSATAIVHQA